MTLGHLADDAVVVCPHNDNYPIPSNNAFRMVPVHGSWHVGKGNNGSTDLHLDLALSINLDTLGTAALLWVG